MSSIRKSRRATSSPAALAAAAIGFLWPAIAAAATTIQGTYFDFLSKVCSPNVNACESLFAAIPAGKTLLLQRVACSVTLPSTAKISTIHLRRKSGVGQILGQQTLGPVQEISDHNNFKTYLLNADAMLALAETDRPSLIITLRAAAASINTTCTIHGTISP